MDGATGAGVATFSISATWDPSVKEGRLANGNGSFATMPMLAPSKCAKPTTMFLAQCSWTSRNS